MSIEQIRQYLIGRYPKSRSWAAKVKKMSDAQVYSVYLRLINKKQER